MTFYDILQRCELDFDKAKSIFYNLTDVQIAWLNAAGAKRNREQEEASNKTNSFGHNKKTFDLKG